MGVDGTEAVSLHHTAEVGRYESVEALVEALVVAPAEDLASDRYEKEEGGHSGKEPGDEKMEDAHLRIVVERPGVQEAGMAAQNVDYWDIEAYPDD